MKSLLAAFVVFALPLAVHGALASSPEEARPLEVGAKAPGAQLIGLDGKAVALDRAMAERPTVLIFFRGGWCPFCNRHLAALAEHERDLRALGFQILAISADPAEKLTAAANDNHVRYRLFSDRRAAASAAYGIAYRVPEDTAKAYRENGIELPSAPDGVGCWLPVPTAFIVNRDGVIRFVYSNPDPAVRISSAELLAAAKKVAAE